MVRSPALPTVASPGNPTFDDFVPGPPLGLCPIVPEVRPPPLGLPPQPKLAPPWPPPAVLTPPPPPSKIIGPEVKLFAAEAIIVPPFPPAPAVPSKELP